MALASFSAGTTLNYTTDGGTTWTAVTMPGIFSVKSFNGTSWVGIDENSQNYGTSPDGINWTLRGSAANQTDLATNGTLWARTNSTGQIHTTTDGITWTQRTVAGVPGNFRSIAWGQNKFVAIDYNTDNVNYSSDGITWNVSNTGLASQWDGLVCNGSAWVAVSQSNLTQVMYSTNGLIWQYKSLPASHKLWRVACKPGGAFVASSNGASDTTTTKVLYSADGITWSEQTISATARRWKDGGVDWDGSQFIIAAYGTNIYATSPDGITWTEHSNLASTANWSCKGGYAVTQNIGALFTQTCSALSTTIATAVRNFIAAGVTYYQTCAATISSNASAVTTALAGGTVCMTAGTTVGYKTGLGSWATATMPAAYVTRTYNGTYWIGLTNGGSAVGRSTNGYTWTTQSGTNLPAKGWWALAYSPPLGLWCAGAADGTVATSPDGITWTTRTPSITGQNWNGCAWGADKFVLTGRTSANFMTSPDGINWTTRNSANGVISGVWNDCIYDGTTFVTCDQNSTTRVLISADGITWSQKTFTTAKSLWFLATNGNGTIVCAADNSAQAVVSTDHGLTWGNATLPSSRRWGVAGVAWTGQKFIMCCYNNSSVAESVDGLTWTSATGLTGAYTGPLKAAWVASVSSGTTFTQSCLATASDLVTFIKQGNKNTSSIVSSVKTIKRDVLNTKQVSSSNVPALLKAISTEKTTSVSSISSTLASIGAIIRYVTAAAVGTITSLVKRDILANRLANGSSTSNTSKAALLNKNIIVGNTTATGRIIYATKTFLSTSIASKLFSITKFANAVSLSAASVMKAISTTLSKATAISIATSIANTISGTFCQVCSAVSSSTSTIAKAVASAFNVSSMSTGSVTKLYSTLKDVVVSSSTSLSKMIDVIRNATSTSIAYRTKVFEMVIELIVSSNATISRQIETVFSAIVTNTSFAVKSIKVAFADSLFGTALSNKQVNQTKLSNVATVGSFGKMVDLVILVISTPTASIQKLIRTSYSALVINTSSARAILKQLVSTLISFFVTINNTDVISEEVIVTEKQITQDLTGVERVTFNLEGTERTIINL